MRRITIAGLWSVARGSVLSLVWMVRRPSLAKDLPRTVRTLGTRPARGMAAIWADRRGASEARRAGDPRVRVRRGWLDSWFADLGAQVTTVEHHAPVARPPLPAVRGKRAGRAHRAIRRRWLCRVRLSDRAYPDDTFDVVVVDGRERVRCFQHSVAKVKPGGLLILDDVDRAPLCAAFVAVDWPREVVHGFAPCKPTMGHTRTAVFTRPLA